MNLKILFLNSLFIIGLNYAISFNEILGFIRDLYDKLYLKIRGGKTCLRNKALDYISKPLFDCVICMASIWSIPFYFYQSHNILLWPVYIVVLAGMNRVLKNFL